MEDTESDRIEITLHEANEGHGGLIEDGRENVKSRRKRRSVTLKAQLKNQESKRWFELCGSPVHNIMLSNKSFSVWGETNQIRLASGVGKAFNCSDDFMPLTCGFTFQAYLSNNGKWDYAAFPKSFWKL